MKNALLLTSLLLLALLLPPGRATAQTASLYFPPLTGSTWASTTPASLGWCQTPLDSLLVFAGRKGSKDGSGQITYPAAPGGSGGTTPPAPAPGPTSRARPPSPYGSDY